MIGKRWRGFVTSTVLLAFMQSAIARDAQSWPDSYVGRLKAFALIEELNGALLANRSATATLEGWCAAHGMAKPARIVAIADRAAEKQASPQDRALLGVGPSEAIGYRRVALACGSHILSRAENWYVPSRLTPGMNALLTTTDTPFGRAIADLHPVRQTLSVERLWSPLPAGWEQGVATKSGNDSGRALAIPAEIFRHRALLYDSNHRPIALVVETYTGEVLSFSH
jgi:chorismate-pyruvate lyase